MSFIGIGAVTGLGDKFRPLAVTGERRRPPMMDVPTFAELGHPGIKSLGYSLNVAAGTPKPIIDKLYAAASRALQVPEVRAQFAKLMLDALEEPPEVAAKRLAEEARLYADVARKIGLQPQ